MDNKLRLCLVTALIRLSRGRPLGTDGARGYANMHSHNRAFDFMNELSLAPKLENVFEWKQTHPAWERGHLVELFAHELSTPVRIRKTGKQSSSEKNVTLQVLSIGSGDCRLELQITKILEIRTSIFLGFTCFDPSDEGYHGSLKNIGSESRHRAIQSLADCQPEANFDAVFIHHALHHVTDLEGTLDFVTGNMARDGVVVIADMVGRSGHRRWCVLSDIP